MTPRSAWLRGAGRPLAAFLAIFAGSALTSWFTAQSWFASDDIFNFATARRSALDWTYLKAGIFQHFAPAHRLGDWLIVHHAPLNWTLAVTSMQLALAGCAAVLIALLDRLCGRRPAHLVLAFVLAGSFIATRSILWWANALHSLPATLATLVALWASVRAFQDPDRRWRWPVVAALAMAAGLTFFEKPVLVILYAVLLRVLILSPSLAPRRVVRGLLAEWRLWVALAVVAVPWYAYYAILNDYQGQVPVPTTKILVEFLRITWLRGFGPGLFGFFVEDPATTGQQVVVVGAQLALLALVAWTLVRRRQAWRAWAFFGVAFLVNAVIVGRARAGLFGPDVGRDPRYWMDYLVVFLIAAGLATAPRWIGAGEVGDPLPAAAGPRRRSRSGLAVAGVIAAGMLAYGLASWHSDRYSLHTWIGPQVKAYVRTARADVRAARGHGPVVVLDRPVPDAVVGLFLDPYNRASAVMPVLGLSDLQYGTRADHVDQIDPDGHLVPVRFAGAAPAATQIRGGTLVPGRGRRCATGPVSLRLSPPTSLKAPQTDLRFRGTASADASIPVLVDTDGKGFPAYVKATLAVRRGPTSAALDLSNTVAAVRLDVPAGVRLCVTSAQLGAYRPLTQ